MSNDAKQSVEGGMSEFEQIVTEHIKRAIAPYDNALRRPNHNWAPEQSIGESVNAITQAFRQEQVRLLERLREPISTTVNEVLEIDSPMLPWLEDILNLIDTELKRLEQIHDVDI